MTIKNYLAAFIFTAIFSGAVYAENPFKLSAGIGGYIGGDFGGGFDASLSSNYLTDTALDMSHKMPYFGGGGFLFFDATYAELSVGFFGGSGASETLFDIAMTDLNLPPFAIKPNMYYTAMNISFLGKYPFKINDKLSVFPLLGIDYQIMLSVKDEDGNESVSSYADLLSGLTAGGLSGNPIVDNVINSVINDIGAVFNSESVDFSALWFKFGAGADYSFTEKIYLRLEALYGLRLTNNFEKNAVDTFNRYSLLGIEADSRLGHGLTVKIAAGYRIN